MNCKHCGAALAADDKFCKNCGTAVQTQTAEPVQTAASAQPVVTTEPVATQPDMQSMTAPTFAESKSHESNLKMIILGIVAVIAVIAAVLITVLVMGGEKKTADGGADSGLQGGVSTPAVATHTVRYQGFSMEVPDDVFTEEYSGYLAFMDSSDEWIATLEVAEGSFARVKANKNQLPALMQQSGYSCTEPKQQTLGGVEFVTMEATVAGQVATVGVAAAGSSDFMVLTVVNAYNETDYSILEKLAPVAKSIKRESYSNKVTIDNRLNLDDFKEIAK